MEAETEADGIEIFNNKIEKYGSDPDPPSKRRKFELPPTQEERVAVAQEFAPGWIFLFHLKGENWKKLQCALIVVEVTLKNAHNFIKPNFENHIIASLRAKLSASKHNLALVAFDVETFTPGLGPGGVIHLTLLGIWHILAMPYLQQKDFSDGAYRFLDAFYEECGLTLLIQHCPLPLACKTSGTRMHYLEWLVPCAQGGIEDFNPSEEDLSTPIYP